MSSNECSYAELLCKSNYSFLTGASHPSELIHQAAKLGLSALALTDRNGVYGIPKAYLASKDHPHLKLIAGAECTFTDHPPVTVIAQNRAAYGELCSLLTQACQGKPKGRAELCFQKFIENSQKKEAKGWIIIPSDHPNTQYFQIKDYFGKQSVLPLFRFLDGWDRDRTNRIFHLRKKYGFSVIASNHVHYHIPQRRRLHDVLTSIREGLPLASVGFQLFSNSECYLKSPSQMRRLFQDCPETLSYTLELAESCTFSPSELRYYYPNEWIPEGHTAQSYLTEEVWKGAKIRYPDQIPESVCQQIEHELQLIETLSFADYFLTVYDVIKFARERKILCQGRGSAANSIVCYCLQITAIDPVRMNLLFERFMSVERGEPPDIDVDFEHERREEVIQYIYEKYGRDRAAMVAAVVTYQKRSAFREISKAFGLPVGTLSAREVENRFDELATQVKMEKASELRLQIEKLSQELEGFPRHLSIHSGGFTLSAFPITQIVPVEPASMKGRTIVQWDKYDLDILGLLKVDLLCLGMLSALKKALNSTGFELATIPVEDPETYAMIQRADTVGTFQVESRAQMSMSPRLKPEKFYDLVIQIALVRPGPIVGKMVHPYLRRKSGQEKFSLPDPRLEPILGRTLGVPIFQEQVQKIAIVLAGFTPGESDQLRRAIGAWRSQGSIDHMGRRLMEKLIQNGLPHSFADQIFEQIQGFSEYGFPESHAASFALITYASCYLKRHYPAHFYCAVLNSQPMGFYSPQTLVEDARRHGVKVLPLSIHNSNWDCELKGENSFLLGFRYVRGMSQSEVDQILNERKKREFETYEDFRSRIKIKRSTIRALALGDAFKCFGLDQRHSFWKSLGYDTLCSATEALLFSGKYQNPESSQDLFQKLTPSEEIFLDYETYGLSVRGHPMEAMRVELKNLPKLSLSQAKGLSPGTLLQVAGQFIVFQRPPTAKGVAFGTLEDESGFLDLFFSKEIYQKYHSIILDTPFLKVTGFLQNQSGAISLKVVQVEELEVL